MTRVTIIQGGETRQETANKADRKHWEQILQNKKHKENNKYQNTRLI